MTDVLLSMWRVGFLHRDAEATNRPNAHPWCVCVCVVRVRVVNGRGFILLLANAPSLYQGRFSALGHAGVRQEAGPRRPAQTDRTV